MTEGDKGVGRRAMAAVGWTIFFAAFHVGGIILLAWALSSDPERVAVGWLVGWMVNREVERRMRGD
jgi:hypothetical protein